MRHWVIIGFMGSGKSTLASLLSQRFSLPVFSTDEKIEEEMQRSIKDIFSSFGEVFFRQKENEVFAYLKNLKTPHIIDCGGGFGAYQEVELLGEVIFLDIAFERIVQRICQEEKNKRPLFNQDAEELFVKRKKLYSKKADIVLKEDELEEEKIFSIFESLFNKHRRRD